MHANDSKTPLGSGRDRHENLGWGSIGLDSMRNLLARDVFQAATWLLEVPGYKGGGPDALSVRVLKALRDGGPMPRIPRKPKAAKKAPVKKRAAANKARKTARPTSA